MIVFGMEKKARIIDVRWGIWLLLFSLLRLGDGFMHVAVAESQFCEQFVRIHGYTCTEYKIYSDDGFQLLLHRVRATANSSMDHILDPATVTGHLADSGYQSNQAAQLVSSSSRLPFSNYKAPVYTTFQGSASISQAESADSVLLGRVNPPKHTPDKSVAHSPHSSQTKEHHAAMNAPAPLTSGIGRPVTSTVPTPANTVNSMGFGPVLSPAATSETIPLPQREPTFNSTVQPDPSGTVINHPSSEEGHKGNPVLLMHSELLNGDSWFIPVERNGVVLPFLLADDGFDVWIGHERATYWSHGHTYLEPQSPAFWDWTWDQQAKYDVPAMLQFINAKTRSKVHYIGVSQSATSGAAAAAVPEVASLLQTLTLIGPPIYRATTSLVLHAWAGFFGNLLDESAYGSGQGMFNFSREFRTETLSLESGTSRAFLTSIFGPDCCLNESTTLVNNGWDGTTSFKNLLHIEQGILTNTFQQYDYGSVRRNMKAYGGRGSPPAYEPWKIPPHIPILIVYGGQDFYAPPYGIKDFAELLVRQPTLVFISWYAHFDLFFSTKRLELIFTPIKTFVHTHPYIWSGPEISPPDIARPENYPLPATSPHSYPLPLQPYSTFAVPTLP